MKTVMLQTELFLNKGLLPVASHIVVLLKDCHSFSVALIAILMECVSVFDCLQYCNTVTEQRMNGLLPEPLQIFPRG